MCIDERSAAHDARTRLYKRRTGPEFGRLRILDQTDAGDAFLRLLSLGHSVRRVAYFPETMMPRDPHSPDGGSTGEENSEGSVSEDAPGAAPPHERDTEAKTRKETSEGRSGHRKARDRPCAVRCGPHAHPRPPHLRLVSDNDRITRERDPKRWAALAMAFLHVERARADETPLLEIPCHELPGVRLMLKDESAHPTGSLKHRLAHALFVHAICNGDIGPGSVIVEASSGSTAISEAWFAKKLGLDFIAVVPATTVAAKLDAIRAEGGRIVTAPPGSDLCTVAADVALETGGFFMDQFGRAAEAPDWRGSNNLAENLIGQLTAIGLGAPAWIVAGAGTGGTATSIGRYLRFRGELANSRLCVVDPEGSAYFKAFIERDDAVTGSATAIVEGIGRARVSPAFQPSIIDHMVAVSDEGSVSGAHWLEARTSRRFGPSTGTNVIGALILGQAMVRHREEGTIVLLGCDDGARYESTIYDSDWCRTQGLTAGGWRSLLRRLGTANFPAAY